MNGLRRHISYANVMATVAVFIALGGTSYAVLDIGSEDVADNSLRSRDIRNSTIRSRDVRDHTLRARDLRRNSVGAGVVKESALGTVPKAADAERLGGLTVNDLRLHWEDVAVRIAAVDNVLSSAKEVGVRAGRHLKEAAASASSHDAPTDE